MWTDLNDTISDTRTLNSQTFVNNLSQFNLNDVCLDHVESLFINFERYTNNSLNEKDRIIAQLERGLRGAVQTDNELNETQLARIEQLEDELIKLKQIIQQQEDTILSQNNNIYEITNTKDAIIKAKQEAFKLQTEELHKRQKLITDQQLIIDSLKSKIETLEESYELNKIDLEKRINEKEIDLAYKIQIFETNLNYGHKYFEEIVFEKDKIIKEKLNDLNRFKNQLNDLQLNYDNLKSSSDEKASELDRLKVNYENLLQHYSQSSNSTKENGQNDDDGDETEVCKGDGDGERSKSVLKTEIQQKENLILEKERFIQKLQTQIDIIELNRNENEELKNFDMNLMNKLKDNYEIDLKNLKEIYEHQLELNKCKIQMLEKTCLNYQNALNDLNKSSDLLINIDKNINTYKSIIDELQKQNVVLETEKIELSVKTKQFTEDINNLKNEKENLNKKFQNADQERQKYVNERDAVTAQHRSEINERLGEIEMLKETNNELSRKLIDYDHEFVRLTQIESDYEVLKVGYTELTQSYQALYGQANDLINTNQNLESELNAFKHENSEQAQKLSELQMKCEHLSNENVDLNRKTMSIDLKLDELTAELESKQSDLKKLNEFRKANASLNETKELNRRLQFELNDKNDLIEQLNHAKDFLETTNSQLLLKNIKMQLYLEDMGIDVEQVEKSRVVREYDELKDEITRIKSDYQKLKEFDELNLSEIKKLKQENEQLLVQQANQHTVLNDQDTKAQIELFELKMKNFDKLTEDFNQLTLKYKKLKHKKINEIKLSKTIECDGDNEAHGERENTLQTVRSELASLSDDITLVLLNNRLKYDNLRTQYAEALVRLENLAVLEQALNNKLNEASMYEEQVNYYYSIIYQYQQQQINYEQEQMNLIGEKENLFRIVDDLKESNAKYLQRMNLMEKTMEEQNQQAFLNLEIENLRDVQQVERDREQPASGRLNVEAVVDTTTSADSQRLLELERLVQTLTSQLAVKEAAGQLLTNEIEGLKESKARTPSGDSWVMGGLNETDGNNTIQVREDVKQVAGAWENDWTDVSADVQSQELNDLKTKLMELEEQVMELNAHIDVKDDEIKGLTDKAQQLGDSLDVSQQAKQDLEVNWNASQEQIKNLTVELDERTNELRSLNEQCSQLSCRVSANAALQQQLSESHCDTAIVKESVVSLKSEANWFNQIEANAGTNEVELNSLRDKCTQQEQSLIELQHAYSEWQAYAQSLVEQLEAKSSELTVVSEAKAKLEADLEESGKKYEVLKKKAVKLKEKTKALETPLVSECATVAGAGEEALETLRQEVKVLREQLNSKDEERRELNETLTAKSQSLELLSAENEGLKSRQFALEQELVTLRGKLEGVQQQLEELKKSDGQEKEPGGWDTWNAGNLQAIEDARVKELEQQIDMLSCQLNEKQNVIECQCEQIGNLTNEVDDLNSQIGVRNAELQDLFEKVKNVDSIVSENDELKEKQMALEQQVMDANEYLQVKDGELQAALRQFEGMRVEPERSEQVTSDGWDVDVEPEKNELERRVEELSSQLSSKQAELQQLNEDNEKLRAVKVELERQIVELNELRSVSEQQATTTTAAGGWDVDVEVDVEPKREEFAQQIGELTNQLSSKREEIESMAQKLQQLVEDNENLRSIQAELERQIVELNERKSQLDEEPQEHTGWDVEPKREELEQQVTELTLKLSSKNAEWEQLSEDNGRLRAVQVELERQIMELKNDSEQQQSGWDDWNAENEVKNVELEAKNGEIDDLKSQISELERQVASQLNDNQNVQIDNQSLNSLLDSRVNEINELKAKIGELEQQVVESEGIRANQTHLEARLGELNEQLSHKNEKIRLLYESVAAQPVGNSLEVEELRQQNTDLNDELDGLRHELKVFYEQLTKKDEELSQLKAQNDELNEKLKEFDLLKKKYEVLKVKAVKLRDRAQRSEASSEVDHVEHMEQQKQQEIDELKSKIDFFKSYIGELEAKVSDLLGKETSDFEMQTESAVASVELFEKCAELERVQQKMTKLKKKYKQIADENDQLKQQQQHHSVDKRDEMVQLQSAAPEIQAKNDEIRVLIEQVQQLNGVLSENDGLKERLREVNEQLSRNGDLIGGKNEEIEAFKQRQTDLEQQILGLHGQIEVLNQSTQHLGLVLHENDGFKLRNSELEQYLADLNGRFMHGQERIDVLVKENEDLKEIQTRLETQLSLLNDELNGLKQKQFDLEQQIGIMKGQFSEKEIGLDEAMRQIHELTVEREEKVVDQTGGWDDSNWSEPIVQAEDVEVYKQRLVEIEQRLVNVTVELNGKKVENDELKEKQMALEQQVMDANEYLQVKDGELQAALRQFEGMRVEPERSEQVTSDGWDVDVEPEKNELERRVEELSSQLSSKQAELQQLNEDNEKLRAVKVELERQIVELNELRSVSEQQATTTAAGGWDVDVEVDVEPKREEFEQQIGELTNQLSSKREEIQSMAQKLQQLVEDNENLRSIQAELERQIVELNERKSQLDEEPQEHTGWDVEPKREELEQQVTELTLKLSSKNAEWEQLSEDNGRLRAVQVELERQIMELKNDSEQQQSGWDDWNAENEVKNVELEAKNGEIDDLKSQVVDLQRQLETSLDNQTRQIAELNRNIDEFRHLNESVNVQLELKQNEIADLLRKIVELESQAGELVSQIQSKDDEIRQLVEAKQSESNAMLENQRLTESLESRLNQLETEITELKTQVSLKDEELLNLRQSPQQIKSVLDLDDDIKKEESTRVQATWSPASDIATLNVQLEQRANEINELNDKCDQTDARNIELEKQIFELTTQLSIKDEELCGLKQQIDVLNAFEQQLHLKNNELAEKIHQIENLNDQIVSLSTNNELSNQLSVKNGELQALQERYAQNEMILIELQNLYTQWQAYANSLVQQLEAKNVELNEVKAKLSRTNELEASIDGLNAKLNEKTEKMSDFENQTVELRAIISGLNVELTELNAKNVRISQILTEKDVQIDELSERLASEEIKLNNLNSELSFQLKTSASGSLNTSFDDDLRMSTCVTPIQPQNFNDIDYLKRKCVKLETQLNKFHLICEKVFAKLNQLKIQNQCLNDKIKTMKSSANV